jgi:hypothetical protein
MLFGGLEGAHAFSVVVIDAGHGGKDPGTMGPDAAEKDKHTPDSNNKWIELMLTRSA